MQSSRANAVFQKFLELPHRAHSVLSSNSDHRLELYRLTCGGVDRGLQMTAETDTPKRVHYTQLCVAWSNGRYPCDWTARLALTKGRLWGVCHERTV